MTGSYTHPLTQPLANDTQSFARQSPKWMGKCAFTLAEVLITLGIIGVVAAITMPTLIQKYQEKALVSSLFKFNSTLNQAVDMLVVRNDGADISDIISQLDAQSDAFEKVAKEMNIVERCFASECLNVSWLPEYSYDYMGNIGNNVTFGAVAHRGRGDACYLLTDGTTFCLDINYNSYCVSVDVNGKKKPNRVGRDIFSFTVGGNTGKKVIPGEMHAGNNNVLTGRGTCGIGPTCDPLNLDPEAGGVSPTQYVLLTKKLPPIYKK